jgi:Virulence activator alpha C-term
MVNLLRQRRRSRSCAGRLALQLVGCLGLDALVFCDFTAKRPQPAAMREELLVQVQAMDAGDVAAVRDAIAERLQWSEARLTRFERLRSRLLAGRDEDTYLTETDRVGPYLTLLRGILYVQENIRWAERVLAVIDMRSAALGTPSQRLAAT